MTIYQIAERLNAKSIEDNYRIADLPELRKLHLQKKQLPAKIFTSQTIFDGEHRYAFHHGGRDEMQFNVGEEEVDGELRARYGLCFSLEASQSLLNPVEDLEPFRRRFNQCVDKHFNFFNGFSLWYFQNGTRHGSFPVQKIPENWFQYGTFICLGSVIQKPLKHLTEENLKEILVGFDKLLPIYEYCVLQKNSNFTEEQRIFTRLTSNENNWELPSPHKWKKSNQGKKNIPFENQYGFGHEEWLFNQRYHLNGFQYGFIRGIEKTKENIKLYNEVHLYTVKKEKTKNLVYYLGLIKNVNVVKDDPVDQRAIQALVKKYSADMITEIESINGDINGVVKFPFKALVKFRLKDVSFLDEPVYQPDFDLEKYKRFQPYKLESAIDDIFVLDDEDDSDFKSGKSSQTTVFNRTSKESSVTVEKLHTEIIEALEKYLVPTFTLSLKNISIETMRFRGNIADVVTKDSRNEISIYEVKTAASGRRNIRDAIAQLLDYALHTKYIVSKLVIVSPVALNRHEIDFLEKLKAKIDLPLFYLCYQKNSEEKFFKIG